jgi:PAS domain S-box-containing protein
MLMVPFIVQTMAAVSVIGWLAIRNGERAVSDVVQQYQREIMAHMVQKLDVAFSIPHHVNQMNARALEQGDVSFDDLRGLEHHLWHQLRHHEEVNYIYVGNPRGGIIGVGKVFDGQYRSFETESLQSGSFRVFEATPEGDRQQLIQSLSGEYYDARQRPWYQAAVRVKDSTWSEIYRYVGEEHLGITASHPIYSESGQLLGVLGVSLVLEQLSEFLREYDLPDTAQAFIVERTGYLVASSAAEAPFIQPFPTSDRERRHIENSTQPLIRTVSTHLSQAGQSLYTIRQDISDEMTVDGKTHFLRILPFQDRYGLDWLIVLVLPEAEFTAQIQENTQQTILLCMVALGLTIVIGSLTANWITRPILKLSEASRAIADGDLSQRVDVERNDEVGVLARSFNTMANQLRHAFQSMEDRAIVLERQVAERTRHLTEANQHLKAEIEERKRIAANLQASEQKYRALFEGSPDTVTIFDGKVLVDCNAATLRMFRCDSKEQLCFKHPLDLSPVKQPNGQDSASLVQHHIDTVNRYGTHQFEWMHQRLDGELFWAEIWLSTVRIGERDMIQAVIRDVTQRRQDEDALIENARLAALSSTVSSVLTQGTSLAKILDHCADALMTHLAIASARFWVFNPATQVLTLTASRGQYQHLDPFQRTISIGQSRIGWIAKHQRPYMTDSVLNDLYINHHEWQNQAYPIAFAGYPLMVEDQLVGVMAVMTRSPLSDATQQKLASISNEIALGIHHARIEEALRESEARYRSIVENTTDLIAILHLDGTFLYASPNYKPVLGYDPEELIGTPWAPLIHPDDLNELVAFANQLSVSETSQQSPEYRVRTRDGNWRWYASAASCVRNREGDPLYLVSIGRDLSDRIQTEDALRHAKDLAESANQAKSMFLRTMSHELRTPLNGILGFAQTLKRTPGLPEKHYDGLSIIQRSGEHLLMLIEELLDFSRIEAQRMELHPVAFNLAELLEELSGLFCPRAHQKGIGFHLTVREALPQRLWGDAQRLRQVLINLIENAIKFTNEGNVHLTVSLVSSQDTARAIPTVNSSQLSCLLPPASYRKSNSTLHHQVVCFDVADTGTGISDADLEVIFQPFQQSQHSRQSHEGTGLGLSISQKLIDMMGGNLHVESVLGQGSRFWFALAFPVLPSAILPIEKGAQSGRKSSVSHQEAVQVTGGESQQSQAGGVAQTGPIASSAVSPDDASDALPPPGAIATLTELAKLGDIQGILAYLDDLEQQHPELASFSQEVRQRAKSFQVRRIQQFLDTISTTLP